jgi:dynein heavy chain
MLVLKVFRPEKIIFSFSNYVNHYIGKYYLESKPIAMSEVYADSDVKTPLIFVLT